MASLLCKLAAAACDLFSRVGVLEALGLTIPIPVAKGGTGGIAPAAARINLKLASFALTTTAIDWAVSDNFDDTLSANITYVFSNVLDGESIQVAIYNPASWVPTFPASAKWQGDVHPDAPATGTTTLYSFTRINGRTFGAFIHDYPAP